MAETETCADVQLMWPVSAAWPPELGLNGPTPLVVKNIVLLAGLLVCAYAACDRARPRRAHHGSINVHIGDTKTQVVGILGPPNRTWAANKGIRATQCSGAMAGGLTGTMSPVGSFRIS
jgi:hypothetical protein